MERGAGFQTYLVRVGAHNKNRRLRAMTSDRTEPKLEARMFVAQARVPHEQVKSAVRQEKLQERIESN